MNRYVVIDIETTGNKPDKDKIIQVGAVLVENSQITDSYTSLVNTDQIIPDFIQELTGINNQMLESAPNINEVMLQLLPLLDNSIFVAHNAPFDYEFINNALIESGYMPFSGFVVDTLQLSRILLPMSQSYKLEYIADELEIVLDNPHRADEDSKATAILLLKLLEILKDMPLVYLQKIYEIFKRNNQDICFILEDFINYRLTHYNEFDESNFIINNQIALRREIEEENNKGNEVDLTQFRTIFTENGLLIDKFPDFELRHEQKDMSLEIWNAFHDNTHLLCEAGTGTGKTLAYLIPSIYWSKTNDERVVIATHTINLQEQLFHKDIPVLKEILPFDFFVSILKGRNNYLCLRKFELLLSQQNNIDFSSENLIDMTQILTWLTLTQNGDFEEINLSFSGKNLWSEVKSDADSCLNRTCPWFKFCYYHRAKQKAQVADIIITNHSLLLTNLKTEHRILPTYNRLIIDEAHQFNEVASKHLGIELNQYQFNYFLTRYYKDAKNGYLVNLANELFSSQNPNQITIANNIKSKIIPLISQINDEIQGYFDIISDYVNSTVKSQEINRKTLRIVNRIIQSNEWKKIMVVADNLYIKLVEWVNEMEEISQQMRKVEIDEILYGDFSGYLKDLKGITSSFSKWNNLSDSNMVYWVETILKGKKSISYLFAVPIEVGPYIKDSLIDKVDSVIMTSATLSVNGSFAYSSKEFGFDSNADELRSLLLPTPFDYKEQSLVCIPSDAPYIQDVSEDQYINHIAKNIADLSIILEGRTLILFTSHLMLQKTYLVLRELLEPYQIKVLGHGIDSSSRSKLTKTFVSNNKTILLGTNSFWEGVDIPGDNLSALVIVRLPFTPPNNPVQEAKEEKLKAQQLNSFMDLSVPQAVIRFKQGFGRLIRTRKDRGIVIVFDKRIVESRYGKIFINSLPEVNIKYQSFSNILKDVERWFY
ncbi:MAG: ATP-dependent DNA helicase DinG [Vulcanibacillus sp.]